jgi:hypothetical protein
MVKITLSGNMELLECYISPELSEFKDIPLLQDSSARPTIMLRKKSKRQFKTNSPVLWGDQECHWVITRAIFREQRFKYHALTGSKHPTQHATPGTEDRSLQKGYSHESN